MSGRRPRETDGRARNWRASRFRVNALATRPQTKITRSCFAACVRRFAARGCVRGGLAGWASGVARPSAWPTLAGSFADCLSAHRETAPPRKVSGSRFPRPKCANSQATEALRPKSGRHGGRGTRKSRVLSRVDRCRGPLKPSLRQLHEDLRGTVPLPVRTLHRKLLPAPGREGLSEGLDLFSAPLSFRAEARARLSGSIARCCRCRRRAQSDCLGRAPTAAGSGLRSSPSSRRRAPRTQAPTPGCDCLRSGSRSSRLLR